MTVARQCSTVGCPKPVRARELCATHYAALRSKGGVPRRKPPVEAFWDNVNKAGPIPAHRPDLGPCWIWTGYLHPHPIYGGYGQTSGRVGSSRRAHIVAYELLIGAIPDGLELDHLCRNRACVNVLTHIELVTHRENQLRGTSAFAVNAAKTHCLNGHEFTPANTYISPGQPGMRKCKTCRRETLRRWQQAHPERVRELNRRHARRR